MAMGDQFDMDFLRTFQGLQQQELYPSPFDGVQEYRPRAVEPSSHDNNLDQLFPEIIQQSVHHESIEPQQHQTLGRDQEENDTFWRKRKRQSPSSRHKNREPDRPCTETPPSKAAIKRAKLAKKIGPDRVGSDGEPKGVVRAAANGYLEWLQESKGRWRPAAPHDAFRAELIQRDSTQDAYHRRPEEGPGHLDVTSNCSYLGQNKWNLDREGWEDIIDSDGNRVMFLPEKPLRRGSYPNPGYLFHRGLIMLDPDDHPVLDWPGLPLCFSSQLEGGRMEALRKTMPWLSGKDFRARMPREIKDNHDRYKSLPKASTFGQRMSRFRERTKCIPWIDRTGTADRRLRIIREQSTIVEDTGCSDESQMLSPFEAAIDDTDRKRLKHSHERFVDADPSPLPCARQIRRHTDDSDSPMPSSTWWDDSGIVSQGHPPFSVHPESRTLNSNPHNSSPSFTGLPGPMPSTVDMRFLKPRSIEDQLNIKVALSITRADYRSRYGHEAPVTASDESYHLQYTQIQQAHEDNVIFGAPSERLICVDAFYDSFANWKLPQCLDAARLLSVMEGPRDVGTSMFGLGNDLAAAIGAEDWSLPSMNAY